MPSPIYQYVVNLVMSLPIRRSPGALMNVQLDALIPQKFLFWNENLHVSDCSSVHNQEFSTVHTAMLYAIQICWQLASRIRMELPTLCTVENSWLWTEELSETCRVSFQNKNFWGISASSWFYYKKV